MDAELLFQTVQEALFLVLLLCAPVLCAALLTSVFVGWLTHYTKLSEPAIGNVARVLAILSGLLVFSPWIGNRILAFSVKTLQLLQSVAS